MTPILPNSISWLSILRQRHYYMLLHHQPIKYTFPDYTGDARSLSYAGSVDRFERLFLLQALNANTLLSKDSRWRQSLAIEEIHLHSGVMNNGESGGKQQSRMEGVASVQESDGSFTPTTSTTPQDLESKSDPRCEDEDSVPITLHSGTIPTRSPSPRLPGGFVRPDDESDAGEPGNISEMSSTESFVTATATPNPDPSEPDVIPVS